MKLSVLAELGLLKFPQETYRQHELWLVVDRTRYTWEAITPSGFCMRSQRWYKQPDTEIVKARLQIDRELAVSQIRGVVGWL